MSSQKQQQEETESTPPAPIVKEKAPCLETIYKRLRECNGSIMALFHDLNYLTRTTPPKEESELPDEEQKTGASPNLTDLQYEVDVLRNHIRDCRNKLTKARWG